MSRQLFFMLVAFAALPCVAAFGTERTMPTDKPSDAAFATIDYVRGYVRWQPFDDAKWRPMKEGTVVPMRGRIAIGMSAAFVIRIGETKHTYDTGGIYELATGEPSRYVPRDSDPPGIKSMPKPKPKPKLKDQNSANNGPLPDEVTVTTVKGIVQWRASDNDNWNKATVGTKLKMGTQVRTGLRSAIVFTAADGRSVTLDRLAIVTLKDTWRSDGKIKTDIGMKYGRAKYTVKAASDPRENNADCAKQWSPAATLQIRRPRSLEDIEFGIPFEHRHQQSPENVDTTPAPNADASKCDAEEPQEEASRSSSDVTVDAVRGSVQWRAKPGDRWSRLKLSDRLSPTAEIRTGLRSYAIFRLGDKTFTVDRLGIRSIEELLTGELPTFTERYGRKHYKVNGVEVIESRIHAPSVTLSGWGMVMVAKNVPLAEVAYPTVGPFNRGQIRGVIIENWPGRIDWVFECRRLSAEEMKNLRRVRRKFPTAEEHESVIHVPSATLRIGRPVNLHDTRNYNEPPQCSSDERRLGKTVEVIEPYRWYEKPMSLLQSISIDKLFEAIGLPDLKQPK